jgi:hypothetical protein
MYRIDLNTEINELEEMISGKDHEEVVALR